MTEFKSRFKDVARLGTPRGPSTLAAKHSDPSDNPIRINILRRMYSFCSRRRERENRQINRFRVHVWAVSGGCSMEKPPRWPWMDRRPIWGAHIYIESHRLGINYKRLTSRACHMYRIAMLPQRHW